MTELTPADPAVTDSPIMPQHRPMLPGVNAGAVSIEVERAIAEARGQMQLAKMFPRDLNSAFAELMTSCQQKSMADVAFYSVPRGKDRDGNEKHVTGTSIRLAEEIARVYGNFEFGHRELSRSNGKSEVEVYAWDKQANNRSIRQITVMHVIDTKYGPKPCRDQAEVDALIANKASKQVRGRILALVPKWLEAAAIEQCKKTLAGASDKPISVQVRDMLTAFAKYGVTLTHIEQYLDKKADACTLDDLVELRGIYTALREGQPVNDYFGSEKKAEDETTGPVTAPAAGAAPANDNKPHAATRGRRAAAAAPAAGPVDDGAGEKAPPPAEDHKQPSAPEPAAPAAAQASAPAAPDHERLF